MIILNDLSNDIYGILDSENNIDWNLNRSVNDIDWILTIINATAMFDDVWMI